MSLAPRTGLAVKPTPETYEALQRAYDHLRWRLFDDELPDCLITLQRRARSYGYFARGRFRRSDGLKADEIALNPAHFQDRTLEEILSTMAHDMVHLWQHHRGEPGRGRYHNREWADKMKSIGLHPSDTGREGGRETGDRVQHYFIALGPFANAAAELRDREFVIPWSETPEFESEPGKSGSAGSEGKGGKRARYTCPLCKLNAWARHEAKLICGNDHVPMEVADKVETEERPRPEPEPFEDDGQVRALSSPASSGLVLGRGRDHLRS